MSVQPILFDTLRFTTKRYIFENKDVTPYNSNLIVIQNDRIGIGTTSPDPNYACTIQGNTVIKGSLDTSFIDAPNSNLGYLVLGNNGSYPVIDIIQQSAQPYMLLRDANSNIISLFNEHGNLGIGTTLAYEALVVNGTLVACNLEIFGTYSDAKYFQLKPIQQLFTVTAQTQTVFTIQTTGYYSVLPEKTHVYWNGFKLAYYSSSYRDYTITYAYDQPTHTTTFTLTLLRAAKFLDVLDVLIWPEIPEAQATGKYVQVVDQSYWSKADNIIYINQSVGINTTNPQYPLHVNGTTYTSNLVTDLLSVTDFNVPSLETVTINTQQLTTQKLAIGTTIFPEDVSYIVEGNMQLQNGQLQLGAGSILFDDGTAFSSSNGVLTIATSNIQLPNGASIQSGIIRGNAAAIGTSTSFTPAANTLVVLGNIGIGTTLPQYTLDVNGSIHITGAIYSSNSTLYSASQWNNVTSGISYLGNVGIGTTLPRTALDVVGNLTVSGNLGIGTTLPTAALDVRGNCSVTGNIRSPTFVGMVSYFAGSNAPLGWLECNGQSVSRTTYPELFSYIGTTYGSASGSTFNVPDLRAEFIRGWDNGRGIDTGRVFGSAQGYAMENHGHVWNYAVAAGGGTSNIATVFTTAAGSTTNAVGSVQNATSASETRPRNIAMLPCIKF